MNQSETLNRRGNARSSSSWNRSAPQVQALKGAQRVESGADDVRFVAFFRDDQTTMSASDEDVDRARRHRRGGEPMIWFIQDGHEYVVRDPETIERLQGAWKGANTLGNEQGLLGAEQGKLGAKQGELGALQGRLGSEQGELGALQGRLGEAQARFAANEALLGKSREDMERARSAIDQRMKQLTAEMQALDAKMRALQEPMEQLNAPMEELARKMVTLGGRMEEESRRARIETRRLLDRAIATGAAEVVR